MAEAVAGEVVVADFDHESRGERLPLPGALAGPAAGTAGGAAGEAGRLDEGPHLAEEGRAVRGREPRGEAHVVEQALGIVEPQQE